MLIMKRFFRGNVEIIQWLRVHSDKKQKKKKEYILLLQRTQIHSPMLNSSQPPIILAQGINTFWLPWAPTYTCTHPYTDTYITKNKFI